MANETRSIKIYIDGKEAGKSIESMEKQAEKLKSQITSLSAKGKDVSGLASQFEKVTDALAKSKKEFNALVDATGGIDKLRQRAAELQQEINAAGNDFEKASKSAKELADVTAKIKKIEIFQGLDSGNKGTIAEVKKEVAQLTYEIENKLVPGTKEYDAAILRLAQGKNIIDSHRTAIKGVADEFASTAQSGSFNALTAEYNKLEKEIKDLTIGSEQYKLKTQQLSQLESQLAVHQNSVNRVGSAWDSVKSNFKSFFAVSLGAFGAGAIFAGINKMISSNAALDESLADVRKTTGLTAAEVNDLDKSLLQLNTKSSNAELLQLASAAGKIGKSSKADILGFVSAVDKINVALGEDLGGNAEEIAVKLGKLSTLFGTEKQFGTEKALLKIGSAINTLGQISTASEAYILDFTTRLGGVGAQAGFTIEQIIGMGATLDQLGVSSEVSATALSTLFIKMGTNVEDFAKVAGVSVAEFKRLLEEDANGAFIKVLEGAKSSTGGVEGLATVMQKLGIDAARASQVAGALTNNLDILKSTQDEAAKAFESGTSILDEFATKNETIGASLAKIKKALEAKFVNSGFVEAFRGMAQSAAAYFNVPISQKLEEERVHLFSIELQLKQTNISQADRLKLIKELQEKYPAYFANMDAETVNNEQLSAAIQLVNQQLINKIVLQKKQEEIEKVADVAADKRIRLAKAEANMQGLIAEIIAKNNLKTPGGTLLQQGEKVFAMMEKIRQSSANTSGSSYDMSGTYQKEVALFKLLQSYKGINDEFTAAEKKVTDLATAKAELAKQLGVSLLDGGTSAPAPKDGTGGTDPATPSSDKDAQKAKDARAKALEDYKQYLASVAELKRQAELSNLTDNQRELEVIYDKMTAEILATKEKSAELLKNESLTGAEKSIIKQQTTDALIAIEAQYTAQYNAALQQQLADFANSENEKMVLKAEKVAEAQEYLKSILQVYSDDEFAKENADFQTKLDRVTQYYTDELVGLNQYKRTIEDLESQHHANLNRIKEEGYTKELAANQQRIQNEIAAEEQLRSAKINIAQNTVNGLSALGELMGLEGERGLKFQKALAVAQMFIDSAKAISSTIAGAAAAAAAGGPAAPFLIAGYITSGIATILASVATAKKTLSQSSVPKYAEGGGTGVINGIGNDSIVDGGLRSRPYLGMVSEAGPEYIVPNWMLRQPKVLNVVRLLETVRQGKAFEAGGPTASVPQIMPLSGGAAATQQIVVVQENPELIRLLQKWEASGFKSKLSYTELKDTGSRLGAIDEDLK